MNCNERFEFLRNNKLCFQCLYPGANNSVGKHKEGKCQRDFACPHPSHAKFPRRKHVLVCDDHKHTTENKNLLDDYKKRFILRNDQGANLPSFSKEIVIHHSFTPSSSDGSGDENSVQVQERRAVSVGKYTKKYPQAKKAILQGKVNEVNQNVKDFKSHKPARRRKL